MKLVLTFNRELCKADKELVVLELLTACKKLNTQILCNLIENENLFPNDEKNEFLSNIRNVFDSCKNENILELSQTHSTCTLCFPKSRVVGFKDSLGKHRLGLIFQPLLSNPINIFVCKRVTDAVDVYDKDVFFAQPNLSNEDKIIHEIMMDSGKIFAIGSVEYMELKKEI